MTLPTGAQVIFTYTVIPGPWGVNDVPSVLALTSLSEPGANWSLSHVPRTNTVPGSTTVTAPSDPGGKQNQTVYTFSATTTNPATWSAKYYSGTASGTPLKELDVQLDGYQRVTQETTILDNGMSSRTLWAYLNNNGPMVTSKKEYDFSANLARETTVTYLTSSAYTNIHIIDLPASIQVYGAGGAATGPLMAQTNYAYDSTPISATSGSLGNSVLGSTGHDDTNFGTGNTVRGNLTSVSQMVSSGSFITTKTNYYNILGEIIQAKDGNGNSTLFDYTDTWASGTASCVPGTTYAYPTTITYPTTVTNKKVTTYNACDGTVHAVQDQNDLNASRAGTVYTYDGLQRVTNISFADGGNQQTDFGGTALPEVITTTVTATPDPPIVSTKTLDGLGRVVHTALTSDPDCSSGDRTDTTYDGLGRVYTVSNPYCTTSDPSYGSTTYAYDALGRTTQVTHQPDGTTVLTSYTGRATQVQDEGNGTQRVTRISQTDGFGRLVSVCEASGTSLIGSGGTSVACSQDIAATGFLTTYQYDALDNLLQVNQSGIGARTFAYDSFSRLTSASNPESGTICYGTYTAGVCQGNGYDANGNLVTKTDARNITTTYAYDALNRLTGKTYSDGTPAATFNYDQTSALGVTLTNTIGRKSSESTGGSSPTGSVFSYDPMGRVANNSQCTPQNCGTAVFAFQYTQYDFLGDLTSATNAAGVIFTYSYNGAARLTSIATNFVDSTHPGTLLSNATYIAPGFLKTVLLGNGVTETRTYNPRLQLTSLTAGTVYSLSMGSYAPNGNVLAANDSANGNWVYKYDDFNRLICSNFASNGTCLAPTSGIPTYTYDYDHFGNRWHQNGPNSSQLGFDANNRITGVAGVGYDSSGNLTSDGSGPGAHTYFYDAENRIIQVDGTLGTCSTATACYVYDAEGRRVRKTKTTGTLDFLYDKDGNKVAEVDSTGVFQRGELYAGGRHFAVYAPDPGPSGATFFIHADWLGTERARTNMTGAVCETITSLPFGDGQTIGDTCGDSAGDVSPMHFTGKERDSESGLDNFGARYDSSSTGRFMSPDDGSGQRWQNPQSLNLYSYVLNNPLSNIDPTGHDCVYLNNAGNGVESVDQNSSPGECGSSGGYWVNGLVTNVQVNSDAGTVDLTGTTNGSNTTSAHYQSPSLPSDFDIRAGIVFGVDGRRLAALDAFARWFNVASTPCGGNPNVSCGVAFPFGAGGNSALELMASRPGWAATPGGFVNWLKNLQRAGKTLTAEEADAVISEAKSLGVEVRLDPPHPGTNWDVPHLNIGNNGQVHLEVPAGYTNPGVATGHP